MNEIEVTPAKVKRLKLIGPIAAFGVLVGFVLMATNGAASAAKNVRLFICFLTGHKVSGGGR